MLGHIQFISLLKLDFSPYSHCLPFPLPPSITGWSFWLLLKQSAGKHIWGSWCSDTCLAMSGLWYNLINIFYASVAPCVHGSQINLCKTLRERQLFCLSPLYNRSGYRSMITCLRCLKLVAGLRLYSVKMPSFPTLSSPVYHDILEFLKTTCGKIWFLLGG